MLILVKAERDKWLKEPRGLRSGGNRGALDGPEAAYSAVLILCAAQTALIRLPASASRNIPRMSGEEEHLSREELVDREWQARCLEHEELQRLSINETWSVPSERPWHPRIT